MMRIFAAFMLGALLSTFGLTYIARRGWLRDGLASTKLPRTMTAIGWFISIALIAIVLSGCTSTVGPALKPDLPALPATKPCPPFPVTKLHDDLGVKAAQWRSVAICQAGRNNGFLWFYANLKTGLAGKD